MYRRWGKPLFDWLISILLMPLWLPILLVTCLLLLLVKIYFRLNNLKYNIFFTQTRPGMHGELFLVYKLASMTDTRNILGQLLPDEQRLFPLGRLLRKYGIDELPQILNILKGEMSWIGPRPLLPYYTKHYTTRQAKRLFVRPGLSGWAQVHGRNTLNWEEKLELDAWYAEHCSLALDLQILGMTLAQFLTGKLQQDTRLEQPWQTDQISTANTDKN